MEGEEYIYQAQAQQEQIDIILMRHRLHFLGHLTRMDDHRMPKQLLLCTPARGSRPLGVPCLRRNDIIRANLRHPNAEDNWHQKAQDCVAWRLEVDAAQTINSERETQEKEAKDKKKKWRREEQSAEKADALVCPEEGCTFMA